MYARLRSILLTASIISAGFGALTLTSCEEDKCKAIACANGSICDDGFCKCPDGYEGSRCETVNRDRFKGIWQVNEDGSLSSTSQYSVTVEDGSRITEVLIKNFGNYFTNNVKAHVKGDTLYIDKQGLGLGNKDSVEGKGYIADDKFYGKKAKMVIKYQTKDANGIVNDFGTEIGSDNPSVWNKIK